MATDMLTFYMEGVHYMKYSSDEEEHLVSPKSVEVTPRCEDLGGDASCSEDEIKRVSKIYEIYAAGKVVIWVNEERKARVKCPPSKDIDNPNTFWLPKSNSLSLVRQIKADKFTAESADLQFGCSQKGKSYWDWEPFRAKIAKLYAKGWRVLS